MLKSRSSSYEPAFASSPSAQKKGERAARDWVQLFSCAPLVIDAIILCYGASFTLTLTVFQAFSSAGLGEVKRGLSVLRQRRALFDPASYQPVMSGLYSGGFAAVTVLRNEAAAAVAVGVDMGRRVGGILEGLLPRAENGGAYQEELEPMADGRSEVSEMLSSPTGGGAASAPSACVRGYRRRWAAALLLGVSVSTFLALALLYVRPVRVASLCVLAAQSLVAHSVPLLSASLRAHVESGTAGRGVLVGATAAVGLMVQAALYLADPNAWFLPNGSAIPTPLRRLLSAPLALENGLEEVRLACKCDLARLQGLASVAGFVPFANYTLAPAY